MQNFLAGWATHESYGPQSGRAAPKLSSSTWRDETWTAVVSGFDVYLRRCYGVYEFTSDPACILRAHLSHARAAIALSDGTRLEPGDPVGVLHLWNERLSRFPDGKPDLHWAKVMRDALQTSLRALAVHAAGEPAWQGVRAVQCGAAFSGVLRTKQMRRVAGAFGFEVVPPDLSGLRRAHALGEDFLLWGFARAFNPATLRQQQFLRQRCDLWMSRTTLLRRYLPIASRLGDDLSPDEGV